MTLFAFDDATLTAWATTHRTPAFLGHRPTLRSGYRALRAALPDRATIAYAVKANPHPEVLRTLAAEGASFDCASLGELERVAALNLDPGRIYFTGPGKREEELALAARLGARVQAEGFEDLERLDRLVDVRTEVSLRVHPAAEIEERNRIIGGSGPSAFGVDEELVPELLERAARLEHVRITGLHVFAASNERSAARLLATHRAVFTLARRLEEDHELEMKVIDVGGGLGVPYTDEEAPLDLLAFERGFADLLSEQSWFTGRVVLEPGRYLAAPHVVYLSRVVRVKPSRGKTFVILEGGLNHLLRPLLVGDPFPVRVVGRSGPTEPLTLAGPLCTSLDRLGEVHLPRPAAGDLLAFGMTGAYGATEAMTHFLSHPPAEEVWLDD